MLNKDAVIWITDTYGVLLEEYEGKVKLQGVTTYKKDGKDILVWDWIYRAKWNSETRKREIPEKANGVAGVSLGDRQQAFEVFQKIMRQFEGTTQKFPPVESDDDSVPF